MFEIAGRKIGENEPVFIIAELSANHGQDFNQAVKLIEAAKDAGADAVKVQTYTPDTLTIDCNNEYFVIEKGSLWEGKTLYELYSEAYTPWEWQPELMRIAGELGLSFFSTPFDNSAVDFLEEMGVPAYKIASFELVDLELLRMVAGTGKPVILSTGMATFEEIEEALATLRQAGAKEIALLKCTSAYPALPEEMNLKTIPNITEEFGVISGLSDHTLSSTIPVAAVVLGASVIEKHLTLSREIPGPDSAFSLEPCEFAAMVESVRSAEKALGNISYELQPREKASRVFRRSIFVVKDIKDAEVLTRENLRVIRPGNGLHSRYLDDALGSKAAGDIPAGTPLCWDLIDQREKER